VRISRLLAVLLGSAVILGACSSGEPTTADVVAAMSEDALIPMLASATDSTTVLAGELETFCSQPSPDGLESLRATWAEAQKSWKMVELLIYFGPAERLRTQSMVHYLPVSQDGIDELLASDTVIDVDYIENRAASTQRGLGAIEFVLFGDPGADTQPRACALAAAAAVVAADRTSDLNDAWVTGQDGDPYPEQFVAEMDVLDSLAEVVGAIVETVRRQSSRELGPALGITSAEPDLSALTEGRAGAGADAYLAQVDGIDTIVRAGGETSLLNLIQARSPEVADRIESSLTSLQDSLEAIDTPLVEMAQQNPDQLAAVYELLAELHVLFEADVVSVLGITLGFSDTDGDGG
jgi:predicted lipoprotein